MSDTKYKDILRLLNAGTRLIVASGGILCLCIIVSMTMIGIIMGKISERLLGGVQGVFYGGGIIALTLIIYNVIKISLGGKAR